MHSSVQEDYTAEPVVWGVRVTDVNTTTIHDAAMRKVLRTLGRNHPHNTDSSREGGLRLYLGHLAFRVVAVISKSLRAE